MHVKLWWDIEDDPYGNVLHIAEHGLSKQDVEHAVRHAMGWQRSRSSENLVAFGPALDHRVIAVVFQFVTDDLDEIYPITAYSIESGA